jgi:hypothetical protein
MGSDMTIMAQKDDEYAITLKPHQALDGKTPAE